jgi:hypothetical protein
MHAFTRLGARLGRHQRHRQVDSVENSRWQTEAEPRQIPVRSECACYVHLCSLVVLLFR